MIDQELKDFVNEIVGKAMARDDRNVNVTFADSEVCIMISPYKEFQLSEPTEHEPEKVDVYEDSAT